jgi:hypothetical protein
MIFAVLLYMSFVEGAPILIGATGDKAAAAGGSSIAVLPHYPVTPLSPHTVIVTGHIDRRK